VESLPNSYAKDIETGILVWNQKKIFGGGIKSFYLNCSKIENSIMNKYGGTNCNTHPHNYYLQIASELGLIGLFLSIAVFSLILLKSIKIIIYQTNNTIKTFLTPFLISLIVEIFPLKTTGSFFTSSNATFIFIIVAIIVGLLQMEKRQNYVK
jgi:O-antigen ligase